MAEAAPLKGSNERAIARGLQPGRQMASAEGSLAGDDDAAGSAAAAPLTRGLRSAWSSIRGACATGSTHTLKKSLATNKRSASAGTEDMSPPHSRWLGRADSSRLSTHAEVEASSRGGEEIVPEGGIKPGMGHTIFESRRHGFRLQVQGDSVPAHPPPDGQGSGPVTVAPLDETIAFEGGELEGVLKVHCLPEGGRFDAPLLFDFLVEAWDEDDPIMDHHGRIRYEVLTKDCESDSWIRDPESSIPLEIVKDDQGMVYVRAQVRHFSFWGCFKRKRLDFGPQLYHTQKIPWSERKMHQSAIRNNTPGVDIHVYAMQLSQWSAALESVKGGAGVEGFEANFEFSGNVHEEVNPAALIPQMVTIPSGHSHWFEIPRVGAGIWSSRKAAVVIVTESNDAHDGRRMRMEAMEHLRSSTLLTVTLRVENGRVVGSPCAAESGGILSQVNRVIQNQANSLPGGPPPSAANTDVRSRSETNSVGNETGSAASSTSTAGGAVSGRSSGALLVGSPAMAESEQDASSPGTAAAAAGAGAANDEADAARLVRDKGKPPKPAADASCGVRGTPQADVGLVRVESGASSCAPPAELAALPSPVE